MFTLAGGAQRGPLKMLLLDPGVAAVLADVLTDKLPQSVLFNRSDNRQTLPVCVRHYGNRRGGLTKL